MKKLISKILMVIAVLLSNVHSFAQNNNAKTTYVKIYGNCEMCKSTIEKAGNVKNLALVDWNKDTKIATLNYNGDKTNQDEILKRIALAGYDSEKFLAPDDVYAKLPECCQYKRELKPQTKNNVVAIPNKAEHGKHNEKVKRAPETQNTPQLQSVFNYYFAVKDALVNTDAPAASAKANEWLTAIKAVEMAKLSMQEHNVWMKVAKDLIANAELIVNSNAVTKQRAVFASLANGIYELAKVSKHATPIYYQHCPMYNAGKGGYWLSKEPAIKNPFYGSKMLTCGSVTDTIK